MRKILSEATAKRFLSSEDEKTFNTSNKVTKHDFWTRDHFADFPYTSLKAGRALIP